MRAERRETIRRSAVFDATGRYRYQLSRRWDPSRPEVAFVLLNPSAADARRDDPTIRRCIGFAKSWGFGGLRVVNLFAWRAAKPKDLFAAPDPVGPDNDAHLRAAASGAAAVIVGWGNHGSRLRRAERVRALLGPGRRLGCLGLTALGAPRHPLYLRKTSFPTPLPR